MKVKTVMAAHHINFEKDVNYALKELEKQGREIVDIKFSIRSNSVYNFYAMIIYK